MHFGHVQVIHYARGKSITFLEVLLDFWLRHGVLVWHELERDGVFLERLFSPVEHDALIDEVLGGPRARKVAGGLDFDTFGVQDEPPEI